MINSKKTIAIFGASGFIGSSLVAQLSQSNYHLKLFSRNKEKIKLFTVDPRIEVFDINLNDIGQVKKDLNKTATFHLLTIEETEEFRVLYSTIINKIAKILTDEELDGDWTISEDYTSLVKVGD